MRQVMVLTAALLAAGCGANDDVTGNEHVARIDVEAERDQLAVGETIALTAVARDADGDPLGVTRFTWAVSDSTRAHISANGTLSAITAGTVTVSASAGGARGERDVLVLPAGSPVLGAITPQVLTPGGTAVISGSNFASLAASNVVTVDGVPVTVTSATATTLALRLPAAGFACAPTRDATVSVSVNGATTQRVHPLAVATPRTLAVGQSLLLLDEGAAGCNVLSPAGGQYLLAVLNAGTAPSSQLGFRLRGASPQGTAGDVVHVPAPSVSRALAGAPFRHGLELAVGNEAEALHLRVLEESRKVYASSTHRAGPPGVRLSVSATPRASVTRVSTTVGGLTTLRIPSIRASSPCAEYTEVTARTVYSGSRAIILEDVAAPLAGTMDSHYHAIGSEFDASMFDILRTTFGDPLAMDARLDDNGRIVMLFSKVVNDAGGVAGFVIACDFFPRTAVASSNEAEIFYAIVPTSTATGFGSGTRDGWRRTMRSTVIHEVKHITAFAERIARGASSLEESWLEEGTARLAEELWARSVYGISWKANAGYASTVYCDVRPSLAACADRPLIMLKHFAALYDYYDAVETLSPLGRASEGDGTFYASAWSLVRWAIDHYGASDAAFIGALTRETQRTGLANLEARAGRPWAEMLAEWGLAYALDDAPGFAPARTQLTLPSWNTRDIFAGLYADFGTDGPFVKSFPLAPRPVPFGDFVADVPALRAGTVAFFDLSGPAAGAQLLELSSPAGGAPPAALRMALVRIR